MSISNLLLPVIASLIKWIYLITVILFLPVFLRSVLKKKKRYIFIMIACQIILVAFSFTKLRHFPISYLHYNKFLENVKP